MSLRSLIPNLGPRQVVKDALIASDGSETEIDSRELYTTSLIDDAQLERAQRGIMTRFPGRGATEDSLQYLGRDRIIIRGPNEPREVYERRLPGAINKHRTRGNAWRLLEQVQAYCYPATPRVRLWTERGKVYTLEADATHNVDRETDWDWDGSALDAMWGRFFVIIYSPDGEPWTRRQWGDGTKWGEAGAYWGSSAGPNDASALRQIIATWKPGGTRCAFVIISYDADAFDPEVPASLPDGTWGQFSKVDGGVYVPARSRDAAYFRGTV